MPQNITTKIALLQNTKSRISRLEKQIEAARNKELRVLPARYGFASVAAFVAAVTRAAGRGSKLLRTAAGPRRRQRHPVTPAIRERVKAMVEQGATASQMAEDTGVSPASIANIKRDLGLVKRRAGGKKTVSPAGEKKKS